MHELTPHYAPLANLPDQMAQQAFIPKGINRILLATDGDFNVGVSDFDSLKQMAARQRKSGVSLTTLGFGVDNYNEHLMEQLADAGDGNYAYIDNLREARKVLVDQLSSTLAVVARDVKLQVEFNPANPANDVLLDPMRFKQTQILQYVAWPSLLTPIHCWAVRRIIRLCKPWHEHLIS